MRYREYLRLLKRAERVQEVDETVNVIQAIAEGMKINDAERIS